ncbi:MAG: hypothetical protein CVV50_05015, partial [Spirochaetae bacterium HGW-Spirochaetae-6]
RVKAFGKGEIRLGGTGLKETQLERSSEEKLKNLQQQLEKLSFEKVKISREQERLLSRSKWLLSQRERLRGEVALEFTWGKTAVKDVDEQMGGLYEEEKKIIALMRESKTRQALLNLEIQKITRQLEEFRHQGSLSELGAQVDFEVLVPGVVKFQLAYLISGANWQSFYDARLLLESRTLELSYHASVTQHTGVDWEEIQLILSTSNPALSAHLPKPKSLFIDFGSSGMPGAGGDEGASSGSPTVNFGITKSQSVPCDGNAKKVPITICSFPVDISYLAVPKFTEQTYLRAKAKNTEGYPFLSGKVSVYQGYNYVGESALNTIVPGGELELFMGVEDGIKVERELVNRIVETKGFGGNTSRVTYKIRITVKNFKAEDVSVDILEPLPLSRNSDIKVKIEENEPPYTELDEKNVLHWTLTLKPRQEEQIILDYFVEYPKERMVTGLE